MNPRYLTCALPAPRKSQPTATRCLENGGRMLRAVTSAKRSVGRSGRIGSFLAISLLASTSAHAGQRQCLFERMITAQGTQVINLPIALTESGSRFRIAVPNGSIYTGTLHPSGSGTEYRFITPVSSEVIAVAAKGEGFWQVDFNDGNTINYAGYCGKMKG